MWGLKKTAYHPRFATEVVDGEERVDARDATKVKADHKVPEVLTGDHAVGVLANQDKVWLEGPVKRHRGKRKPSNWDML